MRYSRRVLCASTDFDAVGPHVGPLRVQHESCSGCLGQDACHEDRIRMPLGVCCPSSEGLTCLHTVGRIEKRHRCSAWSNGMQRRHRRRRVRECKNAIRRGSEALVIDASVEPQRTTGDELGKKAKARGSCPNHTHTHSEAKRTKRGELDSGHSKKRKMSGHEMLGLSNCHVECAEREASKPNLPPTTTG